MSSSDEEVDFDAMERDLAGRTKAVVSKSVLAKTLKVHAHLLQKLSSDSQTAKAGKEGAEENLKAIDALSGRVEALERALGDAQAKIARQEEVIQSLGEVATYGDEMQKMRESIDQFKVGVAEHATKLATLEAGTASMRNDVTTGKTELDQLRDGLKDGAFAISALCVMLEGDVNLQDAIRERKKSSRRLEERMLELKEDVEHKADEDVVSAVADRAKDLRDDMAIIKTSLAAVGIDTSSDPSAADGGASKGGGRLVEMAEAFEEQTKTLEQQAGTIKRLERELLDKADLGKVDDKIELKYQEIIDHLQSAISSAADDEAEFKRVAGDLRGMVQNLMTSKADRADLAELRTRMGDGQIGTQLQALHKKVEDKVSRGELQATLDARERSGPPSSRGGRSRAPAKRRPTSSSSSQGGRSGGGRTSGGGSGGAAVSGVSGGEAILDAESKDELLDEVKRMIDVAMNAKLANPQTDAAWASTTHVGEGMKGQRSLVCISCNARVKTPAEREAEWLAEMESTGGLGFGARPGSARRPHTSGGTVAHGRSRLGTSASSPGHMPGRVQTPGHTGPQLGPGGPSLGGGFQVRMPPGPATRGQGALPALATKPATPTRVVLGADGQVYPGAHVDRVRHDYMDDSPGGYRDSAADRTGFGPETDGEVGRARKFNPKALAASASDPSLVSAVAPRQHQPTF